MGVAMAHHTEQLQQQRGLRWNPPQPRSLPKLWQEKEGGEREGGGGGGEKGRRRVWVDPSFPSSPSPLPGAKPFPSPLNLTTAVACAAAIPHQTPSTKALLLLPHL